MVLTLDTIKTSFLRVDSRAAEVLDNGRGVLEWYGL